MPTTRRNWQCYVCGFCLFVCFFQYLFSTKRNRKSVVRKKRRRTVKYTAIQIPKTHPSIRQYCMDCEQWGEKRKRHMTWANFNGSIFSIKNQSHFSVPFFPNPFFGPIFQSHFSVPFSEPIFGIVKIKSIFESVAKHWPAHRSGVPSLHHRCRTFSACSPCKYAGLLQIKVSATLEILNSFFEWLLTYCQVWAWSCSKSCRPWSRWCIPWRRTVASPCEMSLFRGQPTTETVHSVKTYGRLCGQKTWKEKGTRPWRTAETNKRELRAGHLP